MIFKREISIDGVAVIVAAVGVIIFLVTLNVTQKNQGDTIAEHTRELQIMNSTLSSVADSIAVLTAVVNERTGHPITASPRMQQ
jgi:uncharacterized protein YoxC